MGGNMTNTQAATLENPITLTSENLNEFKKSVKISYYKIFRKKGLLTERQFETLMKMQSESA
jgi:hypothetical protein